MLAAQQLADRPRDQATALLPVTDLRGYLAGAWMVSRLIEDRRQATRGSFLGWAWFTESAGGLDYRERGQMLLPGYRGIATQGYRYGFDSPGRAAVRFNDGRVFHDLDLRAGVWQAEHLCGQDLYQGSFAVQGKDHWSVTWRVRGPRKDLLLLSRFLRCRPSEH